MSKRVSDFFCKLISIYTFLQREQIKRVTVATLSQLRKYRTNLKIIFFSFLVFFQVPLYCCCFDCVDKQTRKTSKKLFYCLTSKLCEKKWKERIVFFCTNFDVSLYPICVHCVKKKSRKRLFWLLFLFLLHPPWMLI